jgi:hypothetical protein
MTVSLTHAFTSLKSDGTDPTVVQPSNWNAQHTLTLSTSNLLGRVSTGSGAAEEIPFTTYGISIINKGSASAARTYLEVVNIAGDTMTGTLTAPTLASTGNITAAGSITAAGNVTAYSDARLKENVHAIEKASEIVRALRGVRYTRKATGEVTVGFIAQEVETVLPEIIHTDGQGIMSVAYGNLTAVLVEAIRELSDRLEKLERAREI